MAIINYTAAQQALIDAALAAGKFTSYDADKHEFRFKDGDDGQVITGFRMQDSGPQPITVITLGAFRARFQTPEKILIRQSNDDAVHVLEDDLNSEPTINIRSNRLRQGLLYYVSKGILADEARVDDLLRDGTADEQA